MSVGYPSLRPRPEAGHTLQGRPDPLDVQQLMLNGFSSVKSDLTKAHPLEYSEKHWVENKQRMDMAMLRNTQGLQGPLHLALEKQSVQQTLRLPGLHSTSLMMDTLTGKIDDMEFADFLNDPADAEIMGHPHAMIEKKLGLL